MSIHCKIIKSIYKSDAFAWSNIKLSLLAIYIDIFQKWMHFKLILFKRKIVLTERFGEVFDKINFKTDIIIAVTKQIVFLSFTGNNSKKWSELQLSSPSKSYTRLQNK